METKGASRWVREEILEKIEAGRSRATTSLEEKKLCSLFKTISACSETRWQHYAVGTLMVGIFTNSGVNTFIRLCVYQNTYDLNSKRIFFVVFCLLEEDAYHRLALIRTKCEASKLEATVMHCLPLLMPLKKKKTFCGLFLL